MKWILFSVVISFHLAAFGQSNLSYHTPTADTTSVQLKLTKVELTPDCGTIAWTAAQKFEVLRDGQSFSPKKFVIVLQQCPEFLGRKFFVKDKIYQAVLRSASDDNGALNSHKKENLPTYWCDSIKLDL